MLIVILIVAFVIHPISSCQYRRDTTGPFIPLTTREHWMRKANEALADSGSPCPFAPFAAVIVNHTANGLGQLVCVGVNQVSTTGNPSLHGEMVAINNCTKILTDKNGPYRLSPEKALSAFSQLSLYTNGESCPMVREFLNQSENNERSYVSLYSAPQQFDGLDFKEYIYGTSIHTLIEAGWDQIRIVSREIFSASVGMQPSTIYIPGVLNNETDPYFKWQFDHNYPCPLGCRRAGSNDDCKAY